VHHVRPLSAQHPNPASPQPHATGGCGVGPLGVRGALSLLGPRGSSVGRGDFFGGLGGHHLDPRCGRVRVTGGAQFPPADTPLRGHNQMILRQQLRRHL